MATRRNGTSPPESPAARPSTRRSTTPFGSATAARPRRPRTRRAERFAPSLVLLTTAFATRRDCTGVGRLRHPTPDPRFRYSEARMKKTLILLSFLLLAALPALAQNNEVDLLVCGAKALKTAATGKSDFQHGFEEISYGVEIDQSTIFKINLGRMEAKTAFVSKDASGKQVVDAVDNKGQVEYADATIEYRFAEPFGSTGL